MRTALQEGFHCHVKHLWKFQDELSERVRRQQRPVPYCFGGKFKFNISAFNLLKRCNDWYVKTITGLRFEEDWMFCEQAKVISGEWQTLMSIRSGAQGGAT